MAERRTRRVKRGESAPGWDEQDAAILVQELSALTVAVGSLIEFEGRLDFAWLPEGADARGWQKEERLAEVFGLVRSSLEVLGEAWGLSPETMAHRETLHGKYLRRRLQRRARAMAKVYGAAG